jgi:DNA polymerase I
MVPNLSHIGIREVIVLDAEYVAHAGDPVIPVCLCAKSLVTGREWRLFAEPGAHQLCPLPLGPEILYVSFSAPAEWAYFLASGWELPATILDLYAEEMLITNKQKGPTGKRYVPTLLLTLAKYGLDAMNAAEKDEMRDVILRGHPFSCDQRASILDYCIEDVVGTAALLGAMVPYFNLEEALMRGSFTRAVAWIEYNGIPIDMVVYERLVSNWDELISALTRRVEQEHGYGVYRPDNKGKMKWVRAGFSALVERLGLTEEWPRTPSGEFAVADPDNGAEDEKIFKVMAQRYRYLEPLRQVRKLLTTLRHFQLPLGSDGRWRVHPWPWWTASGRRQPRGGGFIFSLPAWARFLIKPGPGQALAYVDLVSAEFGIAGALSGDQTMLDGYRSGEDVYMRLAKMAGAVPSDATKKSHPEQRKLYKVGMLGAQYGQTPYGLSQNSGLPLWRAEAVHRDVRKVYRQYWRWIENEVIRAEIEGEMFTPLGWRMPVDSKTSSTSLYNFPMQAACAEIMRLAAVMMVDEGLALCATVHDAVLIEAPIERINSDVEVAKSCWRRASEVVLGGFGLDADSKIVFFPDVYHDDDGEEMWSTLLKILDELERSQSTPLCLNLDGPETLPQVCTKLNVPAEVLKDEALESYHAVA